MQIDNAEVQILFAHMQAALIQQSRAEAPERITRAATVLMKAATALDMPVTFALVPGDNLDPLPIDMLAPFASGENSFTANTASPFLGDDLRGRIVTQNRKILIVCGAMTDGVVLHSTLDALALGFRVLVPVDAISCRSLRGEQAALGVIERAGGEPTSTAAFLTMLEPNFSTILGTIILSLIMELEGTN